MAEATIKKKKVSGGHGKKYADAAAQQIPDRRIQEGPRQKSASEAPCGARGTGQRDLLPALACRNITGHEIIVDGGMTQTMMNGTAAWVSKHP